MTERQLRRYRLLLWLAAAAVMWERMWPLMWPILGIAGIFAALALLDVLPLLPPNLHAMVLFVVVGAFVLAVRNAAIGLGPIPRRLARSRLERDSGLRHRPLTALEDVLLGGNDDPAARVLWNTHLKQMTAATKLLRVGVPAPGMAGLDPYGLRVVVTLMVLVGAVAAGEHAGERLWRAVTPSLLVPAPRSPDVEVWVTPPEYTGHPPLFLKSPATEEQDPAAAPIRIPAGSRVLAQVGTLAHPPQLVIGDTSSAFTSLGADRGASSYQAQADIHRGDQLAVRAGRRTLARWPIEVVPDKVPEVRFTTQPGATSDHLLGVGYQALDDYGVEQITAVIERGDGGDLAGGERSIRMSVPLAEPGAAGAQGSSQHDLTSHRWAGRNVSIRLQAEDAIGQVGVSAPVSVVLPERAFTHPVARAIIDERRRLTVDTVASRRGVASALRAIGGWPSRFGNDVVVSLALAVAGSRLWHDRDPGAIASVRDLLWNTALRVEQGAVPAAERLLSEARERLQEALEAGADGDEIERLADELQQALEQYLQAVASQLADRGIAPLPQTPMGRMVQGQDLMDLVEMTRQLARAGAQDRARNLLAELQRLVDQVHSGFNSSAQAMEAFAEAQQMLSELEELTQRQEDLLVASFDALRQQDLDPFGFPAPSSPFAGPERELSETAPSRTVSGENSIGQLADEAAQQDVLGQTLDELMGRIAERIGDAPTSFTEARRAMDAASAALRADRAADAVPAQTEAIDNLRAAAEAAAQAMATQMGGMAGVLGIQPGGYPGVGADPFGRSGIDGLRGFGIGEVEIPDGGQIRHVEEIVRELRRRAGDPERPRLEHDYIDRLLRRF